MKLYIFFISLVLFLSIGYTHAQEIRMESFSMMMEPMTVPMQRTDANGNVCALVKVIIPNAQASFEGSLIGDCDYKTSEYWCYLSPGSKQLRVKYPNCEPLMVNFEKILGDGLKSKQIYELLLSVPTSGTSSSDYMLRILNNIRQAAPDRIGHRQGSLFPFERNGKYGYLDGSFSIIIDAIYTDIFNHGMDGRAINSDIVHCNSWRRTDFWNQDFYWVKRDSIWGAIDTDNRPIIPFKYYRLYATQEDYNSCRYSFAVKTNSKHENVGYLIDLKTGEIIHEIPGIDEGYCRNRSKYSKVQNSRLLHIYTGRYAGTKNLFFDKYTGSNVKIKIPKGYQFRDFMPFNHLSLVPFDFKNGRTELIINTNSQKILESNWGRPINWEAANMSPQYIITKDGLFDLESGNYVFEYYSKDLRATCLTSTIVDLFYPGGKHVYYDLEHKSFSEDYPDLTSYKKTAMKSWQLAWNMISLNFGDEVLDVIDLLDNVCLGVSKIKTGETAYTIVAKDGNYMRLLKEEITQGYIDCYVKQYNRIDIFN